MKQRDIYVIGFISIAFILLYFYAINIKIENFDNKLFEKDKVIVIQGNGIPDVPIKPSEPDTIDTRFNFAYNDCRLDCCKDSSYSCNGGCVCLTPEQLKQT